MEKDCFKIHDGTIQHCQIHPIMESKVDSLILDVKELSSLSLMGIAAIIISLSVGYYLVKRVFHVKDSRNPEK